MAYSATNRTSYVVAEFNLNKGTCLGNIALKGLLKDKRVECYISGGPIFRYKTRIEKFKP